MENQIHDSKALESLSNRMQKQPSIGIFMKRSSGNMQQIYRRKHMPKCDFKKVSLFSMGVLL